MITTKLLKFSDCTDWDNLINNSTTATFFQSKEWLETWMKNFGGKELIIGIFDGDGLIGIAPFIVKDKKIQFMGIAPVEEGELVSDYGDVIAVKGRERDVWEAIINNPITQLTNNPINETMKQWSPSSHKATTRQGNETMELNFIREDSESFRVLREMGKKENNPITQLSNKPIEIKETDTAPFINLPKTWEEYLNSLPKHKRHEIRRKINKALEVEVSTYNDDKGVMVNELLRLMEISHQGKEKFLTEKMKVFFRDIISRFVPTGQAVLKFLQYEGRMISAVLFFDYNNEYLLYNSGFDPQYLYLSPGVVSKTLLIKEAIEKGKKKLDFLRGNEKYKYDLGGIKRNLYKISFQR